MGVGQSFSHLYPKKTVKQRKYQKKVKKILNQIKTVKL